MRSAPACNLEHGVAVRALALDLGREADPGARIVAALDGMPPLSALLLPIGYSREDDDLSLDAAGIGQVARDQSARAARDRARAVADARRNARHASCCSAASRPRAAADATSSMRAQSARWFRSTKACASAIARANLRVQMYLLGFVATNLTYGARLTVAGRGSRRGSRARSRAQARTWLRRCGTCRAGGRS